MLKTINAKIAAITETACNKIIVVFQREDLIEGNGEFGGKRKVATNFYTKKEASDFARECGCKSLRDLIDVNVELTVIINNFSFFDTVMYVKLGGKDFDLMKQDLPRWMFDCVAYDVQSYCMTFNLNNIAKSKG